MVLTVLAHITAVLLTVFATFCAMVAGYGITDDECCASDRAVGVTVLLFGTLTCLTAATLLWIGVAP